MDDVDKKILSIIQKDATIPLSELSKKVGISKTPSWNRIRKMEEEGIIKSKVTVLDNKKIRIGGMVKDNSILINPDKITFVITDFKNEINVSYSGAVPNLFEEGKGVVAEGFLKDRSFLIADKILAKHDANYMPPEVKKALEGK